MYKKLLLSFMFATALASCSVPEKVEKRIEIKNDILYDKVKACGLGIGVSESLSSHARKCVYTYISCLRY